MAGDLSEDSNKACSPDDDEESSTIRFIFNFSSGEFVFVQSNGKQYKKDTVSRSLKKVIKENGLPDELHWHCLRATAATRWASKKVPIFTVSKLLGHSTVNVTTRFYANVDLDELRDAVNAM